MCVYLCVSELICVFLRSAIYKSLFYTVIKNMKKHKWYDTKLSSQCGVVFQILRYDVVLLNTPVCAAVSCGEKFHLISLHKFKRFLL